MPTCARTRLDVPMTYEALVEAGAMLGHGGIVVFDDTADMLGLARLAMEFCAAESCGKCTPCRLGSTRGVEVLDRLATAEDPDSDLELLQDLCRTMRNGSLCALGGLTPMPVMSAIERFPRISLQLDGRRGHDDDGKLHADLRARG